jgi:hypothetical protein
LSIKIIQANRSDFQNCVARAGNGQKVAAAAERRWEVRLGRPSQRHRPAIFVDSSTMSAERSSPESPIKFKLFASSV